MCEGRGGEMRSRENHHKNTELLLTIEIITSILNYYLTVETISRILKYYFTIFFFFSCVSFPVYSSIVIISAYLNMKLVPLWRNFSDCNFTFIVKLHTIYIHIYIYSGFKFIIGCLILFLYESQGMGNIKASHL